MHKRLTPVKRYVPHYAIALFFVVLLGGILRFTNVPDRYGFDGDAARDAIVVYEGAKAAAFPLTGPFSSTGPYTFGPWYYISLIGFSIVVPTTYSPWILLGILSLATILLMADIGRLLYSKTLGIILAIITAIAPTQISTGIGLSNINPVIFFSTLSIWITLKLLKKEGSHFLWFLSLGVALGLGINMHYQMIGLLLLPLLLWISLGWRKIYIPLCIGLGIFLTFIPLLLFNLQTGWHTINGLQEMYIVKERMYRPNSWSIYLFQFWISHLKFIFFSPTFINLSFIVTFCIILFINIMKKKLPLGFILLGVVFLFNFLWLRYYWGERNDVYLFYLSPIIFIFAGYTLVSLYEITYGKILLIIFSLIIGGNMLMTDYLQSKTDSRDHIAWKKEANMLQAAYPNNNILLYSCNQLFNSHKRTLLYFLNFHNQYQSHAEVKRIGLKGDDCMYPSTESFNFTKQKTVDLHAQDVYPMLAPELETNDFKFIDLSPATPSAIKKANWEVVTSRSVFDSTINWWK